jgi:MobA/VirD2-like, nuclease domain
MIAKVETGQFFKGIVEYVCEKDQAVILDHNLTGDNTNEFIREFNILKDQNSRMTNHVFHANLSFPVEDDSKINDELMNKIAKEYLEKLKFNPDTYQYLIVKHNDADHQHVHIVGNRVNLETFKKFDDHQEKNKSIAIARELEIKYGLREVESKVKDIRQTKLSEIKMEKDRGYKSNVSFIRSTLADITKDKNLTTEQFIEKLKIENIDVKFHSNDKGVYGVSFLYNELKIGGKKVGDGFKWSNLKDKINYSAEKDVKLIRQANNEKPNEYRKDSEKEKQQKELLKINYLKITGKSASKSLIQKIDDLKLNGTELEYLKGLNKKWSKGNLKHDIESYIDNKIKKSEKREIVQITKSLEYISKSLNKNQKVNTNAINEIVDISEKSSLNNINKYAKYYVNEYKNNFLETHKLSPTQYIKAKIDIENKYKEKDLSLSELRVLNRIEKDKLNKSIEKYIPKSQVPEYKIIARNLLLTQSENKKLNSLLFNLEKGKEDVSLKTYLDFEDSKYKMEYKNKFHNTLNTIEKNHGLDLTNPKKLAQFDVLIENNNYDYKLLASVNKLNIDLDAGNINTSQIANKEINILEKSVDVNKDVQTDHSFNNIENVVNSLINSLQIQDYGMDEVEMNDLKSGIRDNEKKKLLRKRKKNRPKPE